MELWTIIKGRRHRICVCADGGSAGVLKFLQTQAKNGQDRHVEGLFNLMQRYANEGRQGLTSEQCHLADRRDAIWEFRRGNLRLYFIIEVAKDNSARIVILSHGIVKKHQKTKARDKEAATRLRAAYQQALADGTLTVKTGGTP